MEQYEKLLTSEEFDSSLQMEDLNVSIQKANRTGAHKSSVRPKGKVAGATGKSGLKDGAKKVKASKSNTEKAKKSSPKSNAKQSADANAEVLQIPSRKGKKNNLKVMFLGGIGEVGKNMTVFEYGNDILIVDSGVMFPDDSMLGIDLVVPDITYLLENKDKIRGMVITHGHEDHIGGLPYVLNDIKTPIYASALTCGLIQKKMDEFRKISTTLKPSHYHLK